MEQQKELQKEIREERKLREELADEYDKFREDMGDAAETIEMMTLGKSFKYFIFQSQKFKLEWILVRHLKQETSPIFLIMMFQIL